MIKKKISPGVDSLGLFCYIIINFSRNIKMHIEHLRALADIGSVLCDLYNKGLEMKESIKFDNFFIDINNKRAEGGCCEIINRKTFDIYGYVEAHKTSRIDDAFSFWKWKDVFLRISSQHRFSTFGFTTPLSAEEDNLELNCTEEQFFQLSTIKQFPFTFEEFDTIRSFSTPNSTCVDVEIKLFDDINSCTQELRDDLLLVLKQYLLVLKELLNKGSLNVQVE